MTFFERQQLARRRSRWLTALFFAAVAVTVAALCFVSGVGWLVGGLFTGLPIPRAPTLMGKLSQIPLGFYASVAGVACAWIVGVSLRKAAELREGGAGAIARMMDGRGIGRGTEDPLERRLLNVVDEMALASG